MRPFLLPGLILLIIIAGCKKSSQNNLQLASVNSELTGDWKLQVYVVGIGQVVQTTPDSVVTLTLESDSHYTRKKNGNVYEEGTYSLANVKAAYSNQIVPGISFSVTTSVNDPGWLIARKQDTLTLSLNVPIDGGFLEYIKN